MSLVRGETTASGTWQIRTGGGGPITLTGATSQRLVLRMENTAECPGTFEGWAEITETTFTGTYHGKDCEGAVTDGRLDLHPK